MPTRDCFDTFYFLIEVIICVLSLENVFLEYNRGHYQVTLFHFIFVECLLTSVMQACPQIPAKPSYYFSFSSVTESQHPGGQ